MIGTLKRMIYLAVGLVFIGIGVFMRTINGSPIQPWRSALGVAGGLFIFYCGVVHYLPQNRGRRKELDDLLNEGEREARDLEK